MYHIDTTQSNFNRGDLQACKAPHGNTESMYDMEVPHNSNTF